MLGIIIGVVVVIIVIVVTMIICRNKFQFTIIKMDEAENNIDILLQKKLDLLKKCQPIIKKNINDIEFMDDIEDSFTNKMSHFQLHNYLKKNYWEIMILLQYISKS